MANSHNTSLLDRFEYYLTRILGKSATTGVSYKSHARGFAEYFYLDHPEDIPLTITKSLFESYIAWLRMHSLAEATIEAHVYGVYKFWKFLYREHLAVTPEPMELMELQFRKILNPSRPIPTSDFDKLLGGISEELRAIG